MDVMHMYMQYNITLMSVLLEEITKCQYKIVPLYLSNILYQALLEAKASELASQMTAMSAASTNAEKIMTSLTIEYNKTRQSLITQEITEIVSGANALLGQFPIK